MHRRALILGALAWAGAAAAQQPVQSPVLTIDSQQLFLRSAFGQRVTADLEASSAALAQENQRIAAELEAEERALTDQRPTLPAEDFRVLADAYDARVQEVRREQIAKSDALDARLKEEEQAFFAAIAPILEALMREANAAVVLERDRVFVSARAIDITDVAIARIDAAVGDGQ
ncbi:MAG: OmpH family outer membrane protein [Pseudomonadota bacterium]